MFYNKHAFLHLLIGLFALGNTTFLSAQPLHVVAITEDFASITQSIGGNRVKVTALVQGSTDLHDIQPRPSMVLAVKKADLLIRLGMSQDAWIDGLIQVAKNPSVFPGQNGYLDCSTHIRKLDVPQGNIDGRLGDVHKYGNPHYWLSPANGEIIAQDICNALIAIDPDAKEIYTQNLLTFTQALRVKQTEWKAALAPLRDYRFVTYHTVWAYFFDFFGLNALGQLEPLPGIPPTTQHLLELQTSALASPSPLFVLNASYYPPSAGKSFAQKTHARFRQVSTNVGANGITSYIELFDYLVKELTAL